MNPALRLYSKEKNPETKNPNPNNKELLPRIKAIKFGIKLK